MADEHLPADAPTTPVATHASLTAPLALEPPRHGAEPKALQVFLTLILVAGAAVAGWFGWRAYLAPPWTRDGTVRAYVVTLTARSRRPRREPAGHRQPVRASRRYAARHRPDRLRHRRR